MICVVNFANKAYREQQEACSQSALTYGKADRVIAYSENDLPRDYFNENPNVTSYSRGYGLWLWKPYLILKTMEELQEGDILFYVDSGATFIDRINHLTPLVQNAKDDIILFDIPLLNEDWTKGEVFRYTNYTPKENERQIMGGLVLLRVSAQSKAIMQQWYELCREERLLSPMIFDSSIKNGSFFVSHREDQSLLSIVARKNNLTIYGDPSDYGEFQFLHKLVGRCNFFSKAHRPYPTIVLLNRKIEASVYKRKYFIKHMLNKIGLYNGYIYTIKQRLKI